MRLKSCIAIISAVVLSVMPWRTQACIGPDNGGYACRPFFIVKPLSRDVMSAGNGNGYDETISFWHGYVGGSIKAETIRDFFDNATPDSIEMGKNAFCRYLVRKKDRAALDYLTACLKLGKLLDRYFGETWDYESPRNVGMRGLLDEIEAVKTTATFKPRYEFLKIRIYGALRDNDNVMRIWHKAERNMKPSPLRDRLEGYVGGVLYRQGRYAEALDYFYRTNDRASVGWCVDKLVGADNIATLYEHDPNSLALRYILQDYVNYLIAISEAGRKPEGRADSAYYDLYSVELRDYAGYPVYDVMRERKGMAAMARRVMDEGKSDNPMMWATVLGIIQNIEGDHAGGLATLRRAAGMKGDAAMRRNLENFTLWSLMLQSGKGDENIDRDFADLLVRCYDTFTAESVKKLRDFSVNRFERDDYAYNGFEPFMTDFFVLEATEHFYELNQPERAMSLYSMFDAAPPVMWHNRYYASLRADLDKDRPLSDGVRFLSFIDSDNHQNPMDRLLHRYAKQYGSLANDAIGTRLMREMRFTEALRYLSKVDTRWIGHQAVAPYLGIGYYDVDYYNFRRNRGASSHVSRDYNTVNYKAEFCSEMLEAMRQFDLLKGDRKAEKAIEIAAMFHYGSPSGDGWGISEYGWSVSVPVNEFSAACTSWLDKSLSYASDPSLRCIAYYALLEMPGAVRKDEYGFPVVEMAFGQWGGKYYFDSPSKAQRDGLEYIEGHWDDCVMPNYMATCDVLEAYVAGRFVSKHRAFR